MFYIAPASGENQNSFVPGSLRGGKSGLTVIVHRCLNGRAPQYLAVHCVPLSSQRHLRSAERNLLHVQRHRLNTYGRPRAFAIAGSSVWNSLLDPVRNQNSTEASFRRLLKTFLFACYYSAPSALGRGGGNALYKSTLRL